MLHSIGRTVTGVLVVFLLGIGTNNADPSNSGTATQLQLGGSVASDYGPVKGARVRIQGAADFAVSGQDGRFVLRTPLPNAAQVVVTAGKEGWFNNGFLVPLRSNLGEIRLYPVPMADDPGYRFLSPVQCAQCHNTLARYWDHSKMAHTTSNQKVVEMYNGTSATGSTARPGFKLDDPASVGTCTVCHAPSAAVSSWGSKDLNQILQTRQTEWDGVSCDYCHKIDNVVSDPNAPSRMKPLFRRLRPPQGNSILVFGPYDDVVNGFMAASFAPIQTQSVICATCHGHFTATADHKPWDHTKVYTDAQWQGFGLHDDSDLPVQTTYQEWQSWQNGLPKKSGDLGKTCQSCHMSWRKDMLPYDQYIVDGRVRAMMGVKRDPSTIHPHLFEGTTATQLKTTLSIEIEAEAKGATLTAKVHVANIGAGHWVPTGETMRSVMLLVKATDGSGHELKMEDGPRLPKWTGEGPVDEGNYSGLPGTAFARVLRDDHNHLNVPFWRATAVASDNRIPPKTTVTEIFHFALPNPDAEPSVEARLIYRPTFKAWAQAKGWGNQDIPMTSSVW